MGRWIEVSFGRAGEPKSRVRIEGTTAIIGRGADVDVRLDSHHVSREHARIEVHGFALRVFDLGSANGVVSKGERRESADLIPDEVFSIADFKLSCRVGEASSSSKSADPKKAGLLKTTRESPSDLPAGWAEYFDDDATDVDGVDGVGGLDGDTDSGTSETVVEAMMPMHEDPRIPKGSVINRLAYRGEAKEKSPSAASRDPRGRAEDDAEIDEELIRPDLPPLVVKLHEEANGLLYTSQGEAQLGVEVIATAGDELVGVSLLQPGQQFWWGGDPGIKALWQHVSAEQFPMVTHLHRGVVRAQLPDAPAWRIFHRGSQSPKVFRVTDLLACDSRIGDQTEITYGPYSFYVRFVRQPPKLRAKIPPWRQWIPDSITTAAFFVSLLMHTVTGALPAPLKDMPAYTSDLAPVFAEYLSQELEEPPEPEKPKKRPRGPQERPGDGSPLGAPSSKAAPDNASNPKVGSEGGANNKRPAQSASGRLMASKTKRPRNAPIGAPPVDLPKDIALPKSLRSALRMALPMPTRVKVPDPPDSPPPEPLAKTLHKPLIRTQPKTLTTDEPLPLPAPLPVALPKNVNSVSISDFRVAGMIGHLPDIEYESGHSTRLSRSLLRGALEDSSEGVFHKSQGLAGIDPPGSLTGGGVARVINAQAHTVASCFSKTLENNPTARGTIELRWLVDAKGRVSKVRVQRDDVGAPGLLSCLRRALGGWRFPPATGGSATVTYPFRFTNAHK